MQRTDTEMLDFVLPVVAGNDNDDPAVFHDRVQRLTGALMLGNSGREAVTLAMGAQMFEPGQALPPPTALDLVALELERVRTVEKYTPETDDLYAGPYLAQAAAVYLLPADDRALNKAVEAFWPFSFEAFKPGDRIRELVKGCTLAICEIERLQRNGKPVAAPVQETLPMAFGAHAGPGADEVTLRRKFRDDVVLKAGDKVRIARAEPEWASWVPEMGGSVGSEVTILSLAEWDVPVAQVAVPGAGYALYYPVSCLERVDG